MSANVSILGNLGRAPEMRVNAEGVSVANFSIASNSVRNTPQGAVKKTDWFRVTAIGKQAETLGRYLKKGASVLVRGKLTFNPWLSRDGEARVSADVALQDFEVAGGASSANSGRAAVETEETASMTTGGRNEISADEAETDEISAEMLEALRETEIGGDEPFAGQF